MRNRRIRLPPDTRPRWDDPNLECHIFSMVMQPREINELCAARIKHPRFPSYHEDPSYYWADNKKEKSQNKT